MSALEPPGEPSHLERFRAAISRHLGLQFDDSKSAFLNELLQRRANVRDRPPLLYLDELQSRPAQTELRALAEELTVGETYFFRNHDHYRAFVEVALPDCLASGARRLSTSGRLRDRRRALLAGDAGARERRGDWTGNLDSGGRHQPPCSRARRARPVLPLVAA